jgi:hypothetical protein
MGLRTSPTHLWSKIALRVNDYGWKATMGAVGKVRGRKGRITKKKEEPIFSLFISYSFLQRIVNLL